MIQLQEKLKIEKTILNKMIEENNGQLNNDFILEQSKKVDNLIVKYQKTKLYCISKIFNEGIRKIR